MTFLKLILREGNFFGRKSVNVYPVRKGKQSDARLSCLHHPLASAVRIVGSRSSVKGSRVWVWVSGTGDRVWGEGVRVWGEGV